MPVYATYNALGASVEPGELNLNDGLDMTQTSTTGYGLSVVRDLAAASTDSAVVFFKNDSASDDQPVLKIQNDADSYAFDIVDTATKSSGKHSLNFSLSANQTNDAGVISISHSGTLAGNANLIRAYNSGQNTSGTRGVLDVAAEHASSTCKVQRLVNAGTGNTLFIDTNGNAVSIEIDSEATTQPGINVTMANAAYTGVKLTTGVLDLNSNLIKNSANTAPIGAILPWLKSYTNTPGLPGGWVECNGQTLSDAESVYNGQVIPSLNSTNLFLRGNSTSGGTGGAASVTLTTTELPAHTHDITVDDPTATGTGTIGGGSASDGTVATSSTGSGSAFSILPPYYDVVWIMRVK